MTRIRDVLPVAKLREWREVEHLGCRAIGNRIGVHKKTVAQYLKANGLSTAAPPSKRARAFALLDADPELAPEQIAEAVDCRLDTACTYRRKWLKRGDVNRASCSQCTRRDSDKSPIIGDKCLGCWFRELGVDISALYLRDDYGYAWLEAGGAAMLREGGEEMVRELVRGLTAMV